MPRNRNLIEEWLGKGAAGVLNKEQNVKQNRYDHTIFGEIRAGSERVQDMERRGAETFPALLQDLWAAFYKAEPEMENPEAISMQHRINRPFVERIMEDTSTKETRITTVLDELSSAVAATASGEKMMEEINEREELKRAMNLARTAQQHAEENDEEAAEAAMDKALETLDGAARDVRRAVRESIKAGQEESEKLQTAMAGWGLESGDMSHVPIGERLKLAAALAQNSRMQRIADLVGRMRNLSRARQNQKVKRRRDEIHSITVGHELQHVLPQELGALAHPLRRLDFYRRFTEGQLLQYDLRGEEKQARGPIVAAIDISGSMRGERLEWAIASAMALVDTSRRQKRYCHLLFFDAEIKQEFSFAPGEKNAEKYAAMAGIGTAGGTDYVPALTRAKEIIEGEKEFQNADIIVITDGQCMITNRFLIPFYKWKKETHVACYTVLLGADPSAKIEQWNERVWRIRDLADTGEDVAGELFEEIY